MPHSGADAHYPLVTGSSSRRRLMLFGLLGGASEIQPDTEACGETEHLPVIFDEPPEPEIQDSETAETTSVIDGRTGFEAVQELLAGTKPLTWVFTGDGVAAGEGLAVDRRSFVEIVAAQLRRRRRLDAVVNTAAAGENASGLLDDVEWRSLRLRPDVVVIMLGIGDVEGAADSADPGDFRTTLERLVECVRADGAIPILQTPNRVAECSRLDISELRARVRIIRETARDASVPCIDHWGRWKRKESQGAHIDEWLSPDGRHPNALGHRQLAGLISACIGLCDDPKEAAVTNSASDELADSSVG